LLEAAVRCVKPGGHLVYSTCSLAPEENEMVVQHVLDSFPGVLTLEPISLALPRMLNGMSSWLGQDFDPALRSTLRIPPSSRYEAFFIALFSKREETDDEIQVNNKGKYRKRGY
jgi:16S rRNA C967 or C1407 C5-methylase (RsmB/RsmF family)